MAEYFRDLLERLSKWNVIAGIIILFAGFFIAILATKIAGALTKNIHDEKTRLEKEGAMRLIVQIVGLVLTVAGFVLAMIIRV